MKIIQVKEMKDEYWKLYSMFVSEVNRKFYPLNSGKLSDWKELKRNRLFDLEILKGDFLNYYLFMENDSVVGWLGIRLVGDGTEFEFEYLHDEIPVHILNIVFELVYKFIIERDKKEIYTYTRRESVIKSMENAGGILFDRKIFARIKREEINVKELQETINSFREKYDYNLVLYDTINEEIIDRYVEIYNQARIDMNRYNPDKPDIKKRTKEDVYKKLSWDKGPLDKMFLYVLFDKEIIAGFCSLFVRDENKNMIDQAGGLTTVNKNYRGQNIAKFLKSKIYLKMLEKYPDFDFIRTDTYPWNKYMYRINEQMGFKPYEVYSEIKFGIADIEKYLSQKVK